MEGERKIVTAMFADIVGSTKLAESMDPEDWGEIVAGAHRLAGEAVYRYEGTIAQLLGDGVLAFFGAPHAHEDDTERAVRAAFDLLRESRRYADELERTRRVPDFQMRIGMHTGLVVVGNIGTDLHMEYLAVGDTVNLAARMQSAAEPGTVLTTEKTYRLVAPLVEAENRGRIRVKGKAEPVQVYRLLRERRGTSRARGLPGLSAPLIGRDRELAALSRVLEDLGRGRGAIAVILGEAGLGKSRLMAECRHTANSLSQAGVSLRWAEARCVSYGTGMAHYLTAGVLRSLAGAAADVADDELAAILSRKVQEVLGAGSGDVLPFLFHLLGLALPGELAGRVRYLDGPALQAQYAAAFRQFLNACGHSAPTAIVCDDVHWCDPSSAELLAQVLPVVVESPVAFVLASRPDSGAGAARLLAGAGDVPGASAIHISLAPLSEKDSRLLVSRLLDVEALPESLRGRILARAEGNPFFLEEVLRMLVDRGALARVGDRWTVHGDVKNIDIPDTIKEVLAARIDRLPEDSKRLLQIAAVIGRRFQEKTLIAAYQTAVTRGMDREAADLLDELEVSGLIRKARNPAEREFIFHHVLVQEAVYGALLRQDRKRLHLAVAEAIERTDAERRIELAPVLARHFAEAGDSARALPYYVEAGDAAARVYAAAEAAAHYRQALAFARVPNAAGGEAAAPSGLGPGGRAARLQQIYAGLGRTLEVAGKQVEALDNYVEMQETGRSTGDRSLELAGMVSRVTLYAIPTDVYDPGEGRALADRALALARELNDRARESRVLWNLLLLHYFLADHSAAIEYGEAALAIARQLGLKEQAAYTLGDLSRAYIATGRVTQSLHARREAQAIWEELDNRPMVAESLSAQGQYLVLAGQTDEALALGTRAYEMTAAIGNLWGQSFSLIVASSVYRDRGEFSRALAAMDECISLAERAGFAMPGSIVRAMEGELYLTLGALDRAEWLLAVAHAMAVKLPSISRAFPLVLQVELQLRRGDLAGAEALLMEVPQPLDRVDTPTSTFAMMARARLALARGQPADAAATTAALAASLRQNGVRLFLDDALQLQGEALLALGDLDGAREALACARSEAESRGARRALWSTLFLLARVEERTGNAREAERCRHEAQKTIGWIASHIEDPELRASFLAMPRVHDLRLGSKTGVCDTEADSHLPGV